MKFNINKYFKTAIVICGFTVAYIASTLLSTLLLDYSLKGYFGEGVLVPTLVGIALIALLSCLTNLHLSSYRHASIIEVIKIFIISFIILIVNSILALCIDGIAVNWCIITFIFFFVISSFMIYSNRIIDYIKKRNLRLKNPDKKVLIIGAGSAGSMILKEIQTTNKLRYHVVGFVDDDKNKIGTYVSGVKVFGSTENIKAYADATDADMIIIAIPTATAKEIKYISNLCLETKCETKILPGIYQLLDDEVSVSRLRNVDVQDLLGRDPINLNVDEIMGYIKNEVVLVTGGGGSIGSELCRQIAAHEPKQLIILDIYENNAYEIEQELKRKLPNLNLLTLIASVRDSVKMDDVFRTYRPTIVFHAAAHKHVPLMETSPNEAVKNNIIGTYKVVKCADRYNVKKFVQISTDKAVNPTNIMGATKRVCEMIIQAFAKKSKTQFVAVRFGNVLGSNGSVIPLFKKQIAEGGPVTVTHKDIIRYFMTIPEAVSLVLQAGAYAEGGEIFVLDMGEQVRIYDLACNLIKLSGYEPEKDIEIKVTGLRPGEKLYEERLMAEEGLKKTANDRISIGKPLEIDEQKLFDALDVLYDEAYSESTRMKQLVHELVPTYKIDEGNENK